MWRIISTGVNESYGKKGEKKIISNEHYHGAKNKGWFHSGKYAGSGRMVIRDIKTEREIR